MDNNIVYFTALIHVICFTRKVGGLNIVKAGAILSVIYENLYEQEEWFTNSNAHDESEQSLQIYFNQAY